MKQLTIILLLLCAVPTAAQDTISLPDLTAYYLHNGDDTFDKIDEKGSKTFLERISPGSGFSFDKYKPTDQEIAAGDSVSAVLNEMLRLAAQTYTPASQEYAGCVLWCAYICARNGDNRQGRQLMKYSDKLFRQHGKGVFAGRDTIQEIFRQDVHTLLERNARRALMAVNHSKRSCALKQAYFGEQSEMYLNALLDLSNLYAERAEFKQANYYHNLGYTAYVERIKSEFCASSESERILYWEKAKRYINKTLSVANKMSGSNAQGSRSIAAAAYNALLLSKGLLLNTSNSFESFVYESGNDEAIRLLQEKKSLSAAQVPQSKLDSLDYAILTALQSKGQIFRLPQLDIRWQDVAASLAAEDVAIEFYRTQGDQYGAIVLKNGWKSPKVLPLVNTVTRRKPHTRKQRIDLSAAIDSCSLEHYTPAQAKDLWSVSKRIWTDDIVNFFPKNGKGRVFFAPDGELQITGIEYMPLVKPTEDGSLYAVSDLYAVSRLSSTRELVSRQQPQLNTDIAVYGGLLYDAELESQPAAVAKSRAFRKVASIDYLAGTLTEADSITALFDNTKDTPFSVHAFTGEKGTETTFKTLSATHPGLIHIATHGFFFHEGDPMLEMIGLDDNPMTRSGLLLAGVEQRWFGLDEREGTDDGILTALEIANTDLRGLDLVVLSACETARGDVLGDGVFGLQRGFKIAGANSILMSLWKVDDEATCMLMTKFYRNWITKKMSKHEAFESAKRSVREHKEKGWDSPRYWAAFILLDAAE